MHVSQLIGKHLNFKFTTHKVLAVCKMCGKTINAGVHYKDIIKSSFTGHEYLKYDSDFLCEYCSALVGHIKVDGRQNCSLRNFSFIASHYNFAFLKREEILKHIFSPPEPPFVFCVTFSNKKQIAYKASIQMNQNDFLIHTDKGIMQIQTEKVSRIISLIQPWYTIIPGKENTAQQQTWFTKDEILNGGKNIKNIALYGIKRYIEENQKIEMYRNTALLKLLVFTLNKVSA